MTILRRLSLFALLLIAGCSTGGATSVDRWADARGGVIRGTPADLAREAVSRLSTSSLAIPNLTIEVLDCDRPLAYAWPCGRLFVTRGLIETLTADELAAVIAHEIGHLLAEPAPITDVALAGTDGGHHDPAEVAADRVGRKLLTESGIDDSAMLSMLQKVAGHSRTSLPTRLAMLQRAQLLRMHADRP